MPDIPATSPPDPAATVAPKAWVKLYHRSGVDVRFEIPAASWLTVSAAVDDALAAGWLVNAPGVEPGEGKQDVGFVARTEVKSSTGGLSGLLWLYAEHDKMIHKTLSVYLNNDADVAAFEAASGMKLLSIPLFPGEAAPKKGAVGASTYIVKVPKPFNAIHKPNPKYNPEEPDIMKRKPEKLFVRWDGAVASHGGTPSSAPANGVPSSPAPAPGPRDSGSSITNAVDAERAKADAAVLADWQTWITGKPDVRDVNGQLGALKTALPAVRTLVHNYTHQRGWTYDKAAGKYTAPNDGHDDSSIPF